MEKLNDLELFKDQITRPDIHMILKYCMNKIEREELRLQTRWRESSMRTMWLYFYRGYKDYLPMKLPDSISKQLLRYKSLEYWLDLKVKAYKIKDLNDGKDSDIEEADLTESLERKLELNIPYIKKYPEIIIFNNLKYVPYRTIQND